MAKKILNFLSGAFYLKVKLAKFRDNFFSHLPKFCGQLIFALIFSVSAPAHARWANLEDMSLEVVFTNDIDVKKNGEVKYVTQERIKILREDARSFASNFVLYYQKDNEELKILEAKTISKNGVEYPVDKKFIEDKPLASMPGGFDEERQVRLSFPNIEIGSEIYIKYVYIVKKPILDNFFSTKLNFGHYGYWRDAFVKINSQLPLNIEINDPRKILKIEKDQESGFKNLTIKLSAPLCDSVVSEPDNSITHPKYKTFVTISSAENWEYMAKKFAPEYEKVINQPVPEFFNDIIEKAKLAETDIDQLNIVTSMVNDKIQYLADWRSVNGRFFPRSLLQIADSQVGDCKDFSAVTAAILKNLGYIVQPALVLRGTYNISSISKLPYIGAFNHAFLKVTSTKIKNQPKIYWIDPTNLLSMSQSIFSDIADKKVLILDSQNPSYENSASINPADSTAIYRENINIKENKVNISCDVDFKGQAVHSLMYMGFYNSPEILRDMLFEYFSGEQLPKEDKLDMQLPQLNSRIVRDLKISFSYNQDHKMITTNLSPAIQFTTNWLNDVINSVPDQVNDLVIGPPRTIKKHRVITKKAVNLDKLNYKIDTPWLSLVRKFSKNSTGHIVIDDQVVVKTDRISNEDLKTQEYIQLKQGIIKYLQNSAIIFER